MKLEESKGDWMLLVSEALGEEVASESSDGDFKPPSINIEKDIDEVKPPSDMTSMPKVVSPMQLCHKMDSLSLK